ncbi:OX-2 membrane glycoprotein-like isoform X4 [Sebastes umbrosus]|uniref:OX-2 membrane glycoprotein-like isoform X4 n=1 Tax=Sebastes umbrosus TaxID=72105 RepID=UPI00189D5C86|nr:OX-2 membrane glycoprotein-like isoform X4 [Sebastes umbrosus]
MAHRAVLHFLCVLGVFQKGLTALIETQHTVEAAVGDEACLYCCLMQSGDVEKVTWLKILPEGEKNLASSHKIYGQKVNPEFTDKMEFKYAGLQNTSIVIRRVMEEDEGCYRCLFNTFSEGALNATTCLQLYELHGPFLHVTESTVVSCSATARPAPTVTLTVPHYNSTSVTNTNGTVTVTTTAGLSGLHGNSTQVGCAVRVLSGPQIEVSMMIPEVKQSSDDVVIALLIRKHWNCWSHRDPEENKTPQKAIKDTDESAKVQSPKPTPKRKTLLLNCLKRLVEVCLPAGGAPCMDQPFKLQVDASDVGAGAVLFQTDGSGVDRPAPELLSGGWLAAGE